MLSNDDNSRDPVADTLQAHLDDAASELDTHLGTWLELPLTVSPLPAVLTRIVAVKAVGYLFMRRADKPKGLQAELEWTDKWLEQFDIGQILLPGTQRRVTSITYTTSKAARLATGPYGLLTEGSRQDPEGDLEDGTI